MIPALSPELASQMAALTDELDTALTRRPRARLPEFDERRRALLAAHLGHAPPRDLKPIYCMGDSNVMFFAGSDRLRFIRYRRSAFWKPHWINRGLDLLPLFRSFHIGPATAWKAGDLGSSTRSREKVDILLRKDVPPGSKVLLSLGEIDCRIHMTRAIIDGKKKMADLVDATAAKFVKFPTAIAAQGFEPLVWGPPQIVPRDENLSSPTFPFIGPYELRRDITYAYIERLRYHCTENGIPMVALAGCYHPRDEKADLENFHDNTHLGQRLMPLALTELARVGFLPNGCQPKM